MDLIPKLKVEVAIEDDQAETVIQAIRNSAYTGEIGDGKISSPPLRIPCAFEQGIGGKLAVGPVN